METTDIPQMPDGTRTPHFITTIILIVDLLSITSLILSHWKRPNNYFTQITLLKWLYGEYLNQEIQDICITVEI